MKKTKDTNKGITLIALVITIIVMLILVAVTITIAVKGGLFEYAGRAGTQTNTKRDAEQEYANLQQGMTYDDLINKYTGWEDDGATGGGNTEGGKTFVFSIDGKEYTAEHGMNWLSWMSSEYDVEDNLTTTNYLWPNYESVVATEEELVVVYSDFSSPVTLYEDIIPGHSYVITKW